MADTPKIRFKGFTEAWGQRKLGEVAGRIYGGGTPKTSVEEYWDGNIPWIQSSNLSEHELFSVNIQKHITKLGLQKSAAQLVPKNSIAVVSHVGVGKLVFMPFDYTTSQDFISLSELNSNLIFTCYVIYKRLQEDLHIVQGSAIKGITKDDLLSKEVMLPSLPEQEKLGNALQNLDRLIILHQHKCDETIELKKYMLQKMFPKEGKKIPEIRFGGFTDAWEQCKLKKLTEIKSASRVHKNEWKTDGIPFYRSSDVMSALNGTKNEKVFISEELYERLSANSGKLEKDDILITGGGSVGIPYIVPDNNPLYTKDADLLWIKNNKNIDSYFVYTFFFSPVFRAYLESISHVGTIAHYTITQLAETQIMLPEIDEQKKIGDCFRCLDNLITLHQHKCNELKEVKKFMLQNMFPQKG